jgi:hypothetical protein
MIRSVSAELVSPASLVFMISDGVSEVGKSDKELLLFPKVKST